MRYPQLFISLRLEDHSWRTDFAPSDSGREHDLEGQLLNDLVPLEYNRFRELDIVYEENAKIYIVKGEKRRTADHSNFKDNVSLALKFRGVVYVLPQKVCQEKALHAMYRATPEAQNLHPKQ